MASLDAQLGFHAGTSVRLRAAGGLREVRLLQTRVQDQRGDVRCLGVDGRGCRFILMNILARLVLRGVNFFDNIHFDEQERNRRICG